MRRRSRQSWYPNCKIIRSHALNLNKSFLISYPLFGSLPVFGKSIFSSNPNRSLSAPRLRLDRHHSNIDHSFCRMHRINFLKRSPVEYQARWAEVDTLMHADFVLRKDVCYNTELKEKYSPPTSKL